ncbi:Uu.00g105560.m01.CDS01 [Anthostomella pinea]|uniref:Uu.00g105560.m01.CDS01 n=1 Tax=Anthostomella pinea TaxID=933095 RepID=A0AAI8YFT2_9PEZI|nr:Uu.00g105560.m01.CDS01 [Anthostomella pinea]
MTGVEAPVDPPAYNDDGLPDYGDLSSAVPSLSSGDDNDFADVGKRALTWANGACVLDRVVRGRPLWLNIKHALKFGARPKLPCLPQYQCRNSGDKCAHIYDTEAGTSQVQCAGL